MEPLQILTRSDLERPRSPAALFEWVMAKCEELGATPEAKAFARSGALLPKKFYDEIYPLALFAEHEFCGSEDILVHPNLDNDNYDARIVIGSGPQAEVLFVEITYAKDGYEDSLRTEVASREGHVNMVGAISVSGRRGSPDREVHVENEAVLHSELIEKQLSLVAERLRAKSTARYRSNTILVVVVDDYLPFREPKDAGRLHEFVSSLLPILGLTVGRVILLGVARRIFLAYSVAPSIRANAVL